MSVALAGRSPSSFEIKSASWPLLALRLKSADLDTLAAELSAQYGDKPGFFEDDALVIDLSALPASEAPPPPIDFSQLLTLLRTHRLRPLAVRGGHASHMEAALHAGLLAAPDACVQAPASTPAAAPEPAPDVPEPGALVIDRPLRSGQQAYARGRDLVVMAMVNAGAEVIADGHIHVYAPLRGRAIAGARGWPGARIFARDMRPELVSIAGVYRASDEPLPEPVWGRPASVRLSSTEAGDKLFFEPVAD
ncbi:MAG: septum site-determining protein MinC [Pseudomonadota bacterium]|nr:septum site-determining protein MinC [Pseudomonadota bacterium]